MHPGVCRYNECHQSNLNGENLNAKGVKRGLTWKTWKGNSQSLRSSEMAVKAINVEKAKGNVSPT